MNKTALATLFEALEAGSQPTAKLEALLDTAEGPPDGGPPTADSSGDVGDGAAPTDLVNPPSGGDGAAAAAEVAQPPPSPAGSTPSGLDPPSGTAAAGGAEFTL